MTTLPELQRKILEAYKQYGKSITDFSDDLASMTEKGFSREKALINLALQNDIEIEEVRDMEKRGLFREEAILRFSEDLKETQRFTDILNGYPRKTVAHPTPNSLGYLLPIALGIVGGLIAYVYVRDVDPEMAKDLVTVGLISSIFLPIVLYVFVLPFLLL